DVCSSDLPPRPVLGGVALLFQGGNLRAGEEAERLRPEGQAHAAVPANRGDGPEELRAIDRRADVAADVRWFDSHARCLSSARPVKTVPSSKPKHRGEALRPSPALAAGKCLERSEKIRRPGSPVGRAPAGRRRSGAAPRAARRWGGNRGPAGRARYPPDCGGRRRPVARRGPDGGPSPEARSGC